MAEIDWSALCEDAAQHLDLDERFWDQDCGSFEWSGKRVFFEKTQDTIILEVSGQRRECGRP